MNLFRFFPLIETVSGYSKEYFRNDLVAALTVAVVALPQSMAYAIIAGVDPVYGLYSAIVLSILGSAFGNSNHLATGPTNAISLLIAGTMGAFLGQSNFYQMLFLLTFMVGAIQFLMGALKLGKLVNYVSHSVIVGFTAGAGVIIALGQLNQLLGINLPKGEFSTLEKVMMTFEHIGQTNYVALGLGVATILLTVLLKKVNKNLPGSLLALVFCVIGVMFLDLGRYGIKLTGEIPSAIPPFTMLDFSLENIRSLAGGAAVIAVIGLVEAVSISKAIAAQTQQKLDSNQEFIGQGIANMGGAFFCSIAGSGSFTRSAIAFQNGGRTRMAGVLAGLAVLVILIFLAPYAKYIPSAALAGVIMVVAYSMVDRNAVKTVFTSNKNDATVLVVTFLATVFAPDLEYAIYSGVIISILLFLNNTGNATVRLLEEEGGSFKETQPGVNGGPGRPIVTIQLEGNLYFGSSMDLDEKLGGAYSGEARVFIIKLKHVSFIDVTSLEIIETFIKRAVNDGKRVILSGARPEMTDALEKAHIVGLVGRDNIFISENEAFGSLVKALAAAKLYLASGAPAAVRAVPAEAAELRPAPVPALAGGRPVRRLLGILERLLEDPFLQAELYAVDVMLKKG
ncbi:MAG: SulP family inorganic anion transporter [Bacillota bacterium]